MSIIIKCPRCGKIIEALSQGQADSNMAVHTIKCKKENKAKHNGN